MSRRVSNNYLLTALEAAVAECRRLEERNRQLEEILALEEERKFRDYNERNFPDYEPVRTRRRKKEKPKFPRETPAPQPQPEVAVAHRRNVNDIYREQKEKYEDRVQRQLAEQAEFDEQMSAAHFEAENSKPVEVKISDAKQQLLIETGKTIMKQTGK